MESMIYGIWYGFILTSSCTIFLLIQCSFRRKKKLPPQKVQPPSQPALNSPVNVQKDSTVNSTTPTPVADGYVLPNLKNQNEFAEMTQSTQSARDSPPQQLFKPAQMKYTTTKTSNKSKASNKSKPSNKKHPSKMKKIEAREASMIKTAQLPPKKSIKAKGSMQLGVERTQEDSLISPSLKAVKDWEKQMRKDFPEISERTQPPESPSTKKIELTENLFTDPLGSPSAFSSNDNLHSDHQGHEMGMSLSNHSTANTKTNNDKTTTQSFRFISHHQDVSTPPLTATTQTVSADRVAVIKKAAADEEDCETAKLYTPEFKITRT